MYDSQSTEIYTLSLHDALPISLEAPCFVGEGAVIKTGARIGAYSVVGRHCHVEEHAVVEPPDDAVGADSDRKSTRLNSSHANISYAVFCLKKKKRSILPTTSGM